MRLITNCLRRLRGERPLPDVRDVRLVALTRELHLVRNTLIMVAAERDAYRHAYTVLTGEPLPPTITPSVTPRMRES